MQVGANVQRLRVARGLSQVDLADAISVDGDRIPQQTIVKIEKGTRPLKYVEAIRIARALKVGVAELANVESRVQHDAHYLSKFQRLSQLQSQIATLGSSLAAELVDLSALVALDRSRGPDEIGPSQHLVDSSESWMEQDWGGVLNDMLMQSVSSHPDLTQVDSDVSAPTYSEILMNASKRVWRNASADDSDA